MEDDNNTACKLIIMEHDEIKEILVLQNYVNRYKSDEKAIINHSILTTPLMLDFLEVKNLLDYITNLQQENEKLKQELNCKEYFSSTMPENTEFVILTKNNYDRQQKDIQLELIDYKSRCEKAVELLQNDINFGDLCDGYKILNILNGKE